MGKGCLQLYAMGAGRGGFAPGPGPFRTGRAGAFGVFGRLVLLEGEAPDLARGVGGEGSEASCSIEQAHPIANLKICTRKLQSPLQQFPVDLNQDGLPGLGEALWH
jgi:hypothetical protein